MSREFKRTRWTPDRYVQRAATAVVLLQKTITRCLQQANHGRHTVPSQEVGQAS